MAKLPGDQDGAGRARLERYQVLTDSNDCTESAFLVIFEYHLISIQLYLFVYAESAIPHFHCYRFIGISAITPLHGKYECGLFV